MADAEARTPAQAEQPFTEDPLSPDRLMAAAPGHGMYASRMDDGATVVTCAKPVEEGSRAMALYVPGIARVDLVAFEDAVQVMIRKLTYRAVRFGHDFPGQEGWRANDTMPPPKGVNPQVNVRLYAELPEFAVLADMAVITDHEPRTRLVHVSMRSHLTLIDPGRVTLN